MAAVRPKHMRHKKATAAYEATSQRKAARNVCDKARNHHPKRKAAVKACDKARNHHAKRKAALKACDKARDHHPKRMEALQHVELSRIIKAPKGSVPQLMVPFMLESPNQ